MEQTSRVVNKLRITMPYSQFTIDKVKQDFHLTTVEAVCFFPDSIEPVTSSPRLQIILENLPWAIAVDTKKAAFEVIDLL
jgi:hypothetical protein